MKTLNLTIFGQIRGGKNHMQIGANGRHYPNRSWAIWRDATVNFLLAQRCGVCFENPCSVTVRYWSGDRRRRDVPGMIDAVCHCLERAGIVKDDALCEDWEWTHLGLDRDRPKVDIVITEKI